MPYRLIICERRDQADREAMAKTALAICRESRKTSGIQSAKFYWSGADNIVFLIEGDLGALNAGAGDNPAMGKLFYDMSDLTRMTMNIVLLDPRSGEQSYRSAGR